MFEFFQHQDGSPARADESVAFHIERARCLGRVGLQAQRADGRKRKNVELVAVLGADDKHDVLATESDQVTGRAKRVGGGRTRAGEAECSALDFVTGDQIDVQRAGDAVDNGHGLASGDAACDHRVHVLIGEPHGTARGAHDSGARVGHLVGRQLRFGDGLLHRPVGVQGVRCHWAQLLASKFVLRWKLPILEVGRGKLETLDGASQFRRCIGTGKLRKRLDAGETFLEAADDLPTAVANAGDEPQARDGDALH